MSPVGNVAGEPPPPELEAAARFPNPLKSAAHTDGVGCTTLAEAASERERITNQ